MILKLENISKKYSNGIKALSNIDLTVNKGEFVSIIGMSGSGKSTLLRTINKLISIDEGTIFFENEQIENLNEYEIRKIRRKIGMIFQNYNLVERLTVIENVLHGRLGYKNIINGTLGIYTEDEKKKALEVIEKLGLSNFIYQKCSELSGGQKQRVGIARALMQSPLLLLCDEPIASLDPKTSEDIMNYLKKIVEDMNLTCIVNLHQVDVAKKYSDRIVGLKNGKKIFDGTVSEFTTDVMNEIYSIEK